MKKSKGFTLIELLIVMAVIAILIAIAIPSFRGMQQEARKTKAQGDLRVLKIAIESYYKNNGNVYPPTGASWEALLAGNTVTPNIINSPLYDAFNPTANTDYGYAVSPSRTYYVVWSVGPLCTAVADVPNFAATVADDGTVTPSAATVIWDSNGH
jgi:prepilin-type N-terminal cleavage/methylation domain-containing protein